MSPGHHSKSDATLLDDSSHLPVGGAGSAVEEDELPAAPSGSESRREALDSRPLITTQSEGHGRKRRRTEAMSREVWFGPGPGSTSLWCQPPHGLLL